MPRNTLIATLVRLDAQSQEMREFAQEWLREATTARERDFATALLRHAKGAQLAAVAGRHEVQTKD